MLENKMYHEYEISFNKFVDEMEYHKLGDVENPYSGEKIWQHIKSEIIKKNPNLRIEKNGFTKEKKQEYYGIISSMDEILDLVRKELCTKANLVEYMGLVQEAAMALGTSIEKRLGEECRIVKSLEVICELAFMIANNDDSPIGIIEDIEKKLSSLKQDIEALPGKLNVLFLPYKYSMWDSLESIWQAASRDDDTQAVVMPIPYVERNENGGAGDSHYEYIDFIKYVPVKLCNEVDIEKMHPDAIFIHNPYDGTNFVTSIYPDYYSKSIRNYTDNLVYVTYNLFHSEIIEPLHAQTPGVLYANYVFLQSEPLRQQFIEHHRKFLKDNSLNMLTKGIEDKFINMGSPKIDRLSKEMENTDKTPIEWLDKIGIGTDRKKVLLINTHLWWGMETKFDMFYKKMQSLFNLIEKRDDLVAIWRPHPLFMETIRSTNPEVMDRFMELKSRLDNINNVIVDELEDTYVSLSLSDALFGDMASLGCMYSYTQRPRLYPNWEMVYDE